MSADIPLILFAKAPIAGQVKTRLSSHCSAQQAADIAGLLMQASVEKVLQAWPGKVVLSAAIDIEHSFFRTMADTYGVEIVQQVQGHLGVKMHQALKQQGFPAAVMGCDVPHVSGDDLAKAYEHLLAGQSVIGPAHDGGYYLLGLASDQPELFDSKPWGTNQVQSLTLEAARKSSHKLLHLRAYNDIDEWGDLLMTADELPKIKAYLQAQNLLS